MPIDFNASLPDLTSTLRLAGPGAAIEIYRDAYGIPHVRAKSAADAFFGQGFATAQDRLWQMDYERMRAYGQTAEFLGANALANDLQLRQLQLAESVEADYGALDTDSKEMVDAYAAGVSAFIESTTVLPVEYTLTAREPAAAALYGGSAAEHRRGDSALRLTAAAQRVNIPDTDGILAPHRL